MGKPEPTLSLDQAMSPGATPQISAYSGVILMAALFGRNLHHLHRPAPDDDENNLDGAFWRRHRTLEGILSHIALTLPDHLRLPGGLPDPNVIFMNMAIHTSAICLHQAAIFKADRHRLPPNVSSESRVRCVTAAAETARIMRMISHLDLVTVSNDSLKILPDESLTFLDESIPRILPIRRSARLCAVSQIPTEGHSNDCIAPIPPGGNASTKEKEPTHGIFLSPIRCGP
jgi:hypothetical protein